MTNDAINIDPLADLVGHAVGLDVLGATIGGVVGGLAGDTVGAVHITCADEAQYRVIDGVQHQLVDPHVTPLASGEAAAFRLVNLGAYYEPGALGIAEDHWAGAHDTDDPKLMVVRADAHVGVELDTDDGATYGRFRRFAQSSTACGALAAVLSGAAMPGADGFVDTNQRAQQIVDRFDDAVQMLAAAVCRAELTASDCVAEAAAMQPATPSRWLIVGAVTINHPERHETLVTSVHVVDEHGAVSGSGLGIDVAGYVIGDSDTAPLVTTS